jgi:HAD superfamily hydrolase (TIGR01549 family)
MDGVLADSQKLHSLIESLMLAEYGIRLSPEDITLHFAGRSLEESFADIFAAHGVALPDLAAEAIRKVELLHARIKEVTGIEGTLAVLHKLWGRLPLAVASGSRHSTIDLILNQLDIKDKFNAIVSAKDVVRGKPAPDVFLRAAELLKVDPRHCIVVEDAIPGMLAAKAAGMRCIALWDRDDTLELPADLVVRDLRQVPEHWFA